MATPPISKMLQPSGPNLLTAQPNGAARGEGPGQGFSSVFERSMTRPDRPAPPARQDAQRPPETRSPQARGNAEAKSNTETRPSQNPEAATRAPQTHSEGAAQAEGEDVGPSQPSSAQDAESEAIGRSESETELIDATTAATLAASATILAALGAPAEEAEAPAVGLRGTLKSALPGLSGQVAHKGLATAETMPADATGRAEAVTGRAEARPALAASALPVASQAAALAVQSLAAAPGSASTAPGIQADLPPGALQAGSLNPALRSEQPTLPQLPVSTPLGQRAWAEDVGNRLIWMSNRGESRAELVLTPATLGKLGVSIQISGDQTTAHFVAASAAAREALEQAMPRLREMLQQAGINLGQTNVSTSGDQPSGRDGETGTRNSAARYPTGFGADEAPGLSMQLGRIQAGVGMIDVFA